MANMPANYPYSMLGYGYPPAYLQLPAGYSQQQLSGLLAGLGAQNLTGLGTQNWATAAVAANTAAVNTPLMAAAGAQQPYGNSKQGYPVIAPMTAAGSSPKLCYPTSGPIAVTAGGAAVATFNGGGSGGGRAVGLTEPAESRQDMNGGGGEGEEYLQELIKERDSIESSSTSSLSKTHILRLLNKEISRLEGGGVYQGEGSHFLDVYREKCTRVTIRVLVPVREHPKFNFVGKLLGPKGNSLKRMQEETLTKMAVLGKGSMRDKEREEELRLSGDPKYSHLQEDLHVEITAFAPPAEAYARLAFALTEVKKYLVPDSNDDIRQQQMRELEMLAASTGNVHGGLTADPASQHHLLMTSPSILVPSHGYHIPLLPTPPLDTATSPTAAVTTATTIAALPTKYEMEENIPESNLSSSMKADKAGKRMVRHLPY